MTSADVATSTLGSPLWGGTRLRSVVLAQVLAVAIVLVAANRAASSTRFDSQTDWVLLGVVGLTASTAASAVWLLLAHRSIARRRISVGQRVAVAFDPGTPTASAREVRVATKSMRYFHHADCMLVRGKVVFSAPLAEHGLAGRTPCAVCRA